MVEGTQVQRVVRAISNGFKALLEAFNSCWSVSRLQGTTLSVEKFQLSRLVKRVLTRLFKVFQSLIASAEAQKHVSSVEPALSNFS